MDRIDTIDRIDRIDEIDRIDRIDRIHTIHRISEIDVHGLSLATRGPEARVADDGHGAREWRLIGRVGAPLSYAVPVISRRLAQPAGAPLSVQT